MSANGINFCRSFFGGTIAFTLFQNPVVLAVAIAAVVAGSVEDDDDDSSASPVDPAVVSDIRNDEVIFGTAEWVTNGWNAEYLLEFQLPRVGRTATPWYCCVDEKPSDNDGNEISATMIEVAIILILVLTIPL